jgi:hypothetical protein
MLVLLEDGRPVLYRQERVGENGATFVLSKFRSMRQGRRKGGTPIWAKDGDDRVTASAAFIRKTRLDELPQLWKRRPRRHELRRAPSRTAVLRRAALQASRSTSSATR